MIYYLIEIGVVTLHEKLFHNNTKWHKIVKLFFIRVYKPSVYGKFELLLFKNKK